MWKREFIGIGVFFACVTGCGGDDSGDGGSDPVDDDAAGSTGGTDEGTGGVSAELHCSPGELVNGVWAYPYPIDTCSEGRNIALPEPAGPGQTVAFSFDAGTEIEMEFWGASDEQPHEN